MKRGEIWWSALPDPSGSGPGFAPPVLVLQSNPFNESRISSVVVAVLTSNLRLAEAPGNVRLKRAEAGLPKPSVVNVSQILTIDRAYLSEKAGSLAPTRMRRVDEGLRLVLGL